MKKVNVFSSIIIFLVLTFLGLSCETNEPEISSRGTVEFEISAVAFKNNGGARILKSQATEKVAYVAVTIEDQDEIIVYDEQVELLNFNGNHISKPIPLGAGNYKLTKFLVLDDAKEVIYAAPKEGAPLAHLVKMPLSISFDVKKEDGTKIVPEVISTKESVPEDFGYTTFDFIIIPTFDFLVKVFIQDEKTGDLIPAGASIKVLHEEVQLHATDLADSTNKVTLPDQYDTYTIMMHKKGYMPYEETFTAADLKLHFKASDKGSLVVVLKKSNLVLWNKLGSDEEILNSEVGPGFNNINGVLSVDGLYGNALATEGGEVGGGSYLTMHSDDFFAKDKTKGTVEVWIQKRMDKFIPFVTPLVTIFGSQAYDDGYCGVWAYWSDGFTGSGGMEFQTRDSNNKTHLANDLGWNDVAINTWVHMAFVWDLSGIDGTSDKLRIYRDGILVASNTDDIPDISCEMHSPEVRILPHHAYSRFGKPTAYLDNIKVWDFAKTDFSDRDKE